MIGVSGYVILSKMRVGLQGFMLVLLYKRDKVSRERHCNWVATQRCRISTERQLAHSRVQKVSPRSFLLFGWCLKHQAAHTCIAVHRQLVQVSVVMEFSPSPRTFDSTQTTGMHAPHLTTPVTEDAVG